MTWARRGAQALSNSAKPMRGASRMRDPSEHYRVWSDAPHPVPFAHRSEPQDEVVGGTGAANVHNLAALVSKW